MPRTPYLFAALLSFGALAPVACNCGEEAAQTEQPPAEEPPDADEELPAGDGGASVCLNDALTLAPATQAVTLDGNAAAPITFTASSGGKDVAANKLAWSVKRADDADPGIVTAGVLQPNPYAGGTVTVEAKDACAHVATATVDFTLNAVINPPGAQTQARFAVAPTLGDAKAPTVVYPSNNTRFPRNIYKQLFQWQASGAESFRVTFTGAHSTVEVYTDGKHPLCPPTTSGCWESDARGWAFIASSNAGGTVDVYFDAVYAGDTRVYRSAKLTLGFSKRDVSGALFYWSTTSAGVRRASVSDAAPEPYAVAKPAATVLPDKSTVKCIACHTVSRDGKKMIGGTQTSAGSGLFVYDVTASSPPNNYLTTQITTNTKEFGTFSPDDQRIVATITGKLTEFDANTGVKIGELNLGTLKATHPDWSPKNDGVVFATGTGDAPFGAGLSIIAHTANGAWGAVRSLAPASGATNLFPSYSPDGDWVAYSRGTKGGHGDVTTQLYVIKADGSKGTSGIELALANKFVNNAPTDGKFENNQPTWAPPGDLNWVAFNSLRPYGVVYPTGGTQQIWVAAVDLSQAEQGKDPSFPAFRFSFQDLAENNHRAFWTQDVRAGLDGGFPDAGGGNKCDGGAGEVGCAVPRPDGGQCISGGQACDQTAATGCCAGLVCDVNSNGDTVCRSVLQ